MHPVIRNGFPCPCDSTPLGTSLANAISQAENLNSVFDSWMIGEKTELTTGSVAWLFAWYREQERFTKNIAKTRKDYHSFMDLICDEPMRIGTFGMRKASAIDAGAADTLYARFKQRGARSGSYAMQVCRLVWTWAVRHKATTGVTDNPFAKMGISTSVTSGNRETSRDEYDLYRETARDMGYQSMAVAASIGFELCQRVWDVFGFVDEDGKKARGFVWTDYKPGVHVKFTQSKTGKRMTVPLTEFVDGEKFDLFPDLEAELSLTPRLAIQIVVDDATGLPLTYDQMNKRHRKICRKAGLPKDMTFTSFRHGGITELGDAGITDVRPISGHLKLDTTAIYNKASEAKAKSAQIARNRYIASVAAADK